MDIYGARLYLNPVQTINASNWGVKQLNHQLLSSPNLGLLNQLTDIPKQSFWQNLYLPFACTIFNQQTQTTTLIRDHFGVEPLFYYYDKHQLIFATSIPDIIKKLECKPKLNQSQLENTLLNCSLKAECYTDETLYQDIYRVEPGSMVEITASGKLTKQYFWQLPVNGETIIYKDPRDYLAHFTELLHEGLKLHTKGHSRIGCEFSGGVDSSTVLLGLKQLDLNPDLYLHTLPKDNTKACNLQLVEAILQQLSLNKLHPIDASQFQLLSVIEEIAPLFAGCPHYFFPYGANNIHQAAHQDKQTLLLSGFGGDECVSSYAHRSLFLKQYLLNKRYRSAWRENKAINGLGIKSLSKLSIKMVLSQLNQYKKAESNHPVREFEYELLQGYRSQHVRLRIEDSALVAKHYGFEYRYPLLYPKLVEFCFCLPPELKQHQGLKRLLPTQFLAQVLPQKLLDKQSKKAAIMPATFAQMQQANQQGAYQAAFNKLPFKERIKAIGQTHPGNEYSELLQQALLYGIKHYERLQGQGKPHE